MKKLNKIRTNIVKTNYVGGFKVRSTSPVIPQLRTFILPLYYKSNTSNVLYSAGYYCIPKNNEIKILNGCKYDTLKKHIFYGPFKSKEDADNIATLIKKAKTDKYKDICKNGIDEMARPKPNIIMELTDSSTHKSEQILESEGIYAVFFRGEPINIRTVHSLVSDIAPKYRRCSFSNAGFAVNLAENLNKTYKTTEFKVFKLTVGEEYIERGTE